MKKKLFVIIPILCAVLLAVLFFPLPDPENTESTAKVYNALAYKIVRSQPHLSPTVHWFPRNFNASLTEARVEPEGSASAVTAPQPSENTPTDTDTKTEISATPRTNTETHTQTTDITDNEPGIPVDDITHFIPSLNEYPAVVLSVKANGLSVRPTVNVGTPDYGEIFLVVNENTQLTEDGNPIELSRLKVGDYVYVRFSGNVDRFNGRYQVSQTDGIALTAPLPATLTAYEEVEFFWVEHNDSALPAFENFSENTDKKDASHPVVRIESVEELNTFIAAVRTATASSETDSASFFNEMPKRYTAEYFSENVLVLTYFVFGGGGDFAFRFCPISGDGVRSYWIYQEQLTLNAGLDWITGIAAAVTVNKAEAENLKFRFYDYTPYTVFLK